LPEAIFCFVEIATPPEKHCWLAMTKIAIIELLIIIVETMSLRGGRLPRRSSLIALKKDTCWLQMRPVE